MRSKVTRILSLVIMVSVMLLAFACAPGAKAPEEKGVVKVKVGAILDLSGPTASGTLPGVYGQRDTLKYIELQGGREWKGGRVLLEVEEYDNRYDPSLSLGAYERWRAQGLPIITTHQSADNMQFKDRAATDKICIITMAPTSGALWPPGWVFAIYASYADGLVGFLDWVAKTWDWKNKGTPRVASLTWDTAWGKSHLCAVPYAKQLGIEYVGTEYCAMVPTDVTPQVSRLKELRADYVFSQSTAPIPVIMRDFKRLGFGGRLVAGLNTPTLEYIKVAGADAAAGTLAVRAFNTMGTGTPFDDSVKKITGALGITREPMTFYNNGVMSVCLMYDVIVRALNKVGDPNKLTGEVVYQALIETKNCDTLAASTPLKFDETQRRGTMQMRIEEIQPDGSIKLVSDWFTAPDALKMFPECAK